MVVGGGGVVVAAVAFAGAVAASRWALRRSAMPMAMAMAGMLAMAMPRRGVCGSERRFARAPGRQDPDAAAGWLAIHCVLVVNSGFSAGGMCGESERAGVLGLQRTMACKREAGESRRCVMDPG